MKATGVIRRIDDLGRIVIPKELRKNLRIREGDNLEVFVNGEEIILKKFSMMNKINDLAVELTESMYTFMKHSIFITDTDVFIAGSGPLKKNYINKNISNFISKSINRREKILENHYKKITLIDEEELECSYVFCCIIAHGEAVGMIVILDTEEKLGETEMQTASIVSSFITKYLEQ